MDIMHEDMGNVNFRSMGQLKKGMETVNMNKVEILVLK